MALSAMSRLPTPYELILLLHHFSKYVNIFAGNVCIWAEQSRMFR